MSSEAPTPSGQQKEELIPPNPLNIARNNFLTSLDSQNELAILSGFTILETLLPLRQFNLDAGGIYAELAISSLLGAAAMVQLEGPQGELYQQLLQKNQHYQQALQQILHPDESSQPSDQPTDLNTLSGSQDAKGGEQRPTQEKLIPPKKQRGRPSTKQV